MNRFFYFLPGVAGCNEEGLEARGLLSRFSQRGVLLEHGVTEWRDGPAGNGCCLMLGVGGPEYQPATQLWQDCGTYWLGMNRELRPGPDDLLRPVGLNGHTIELLDGNEWRVPLLRRWNGQACEFAPALPKVMRAGKDAQGLPTIKYAVSAAYAHLDAIGNQVVAAFVSQNQWSVEALFHAATGLLTENYRIGVEEVGLLGLLDEALALRLLALSIDEPALAAHAALAAQEGITWNLEALCG